MSLGACLSPMQEMGMNFKHQGTVVTSLASGNALVLVFGDASCLLLQKVEMGIVETLAF